MTVILDEGVPRDLVSLLRSKGNDVVAFPKAWKGTKNGELMKLIGNGGFACFVTSDKNLPYQQNLGALPFSVVVLPVNKLEYLLQLIDTINAAISSATPGAAYWVDP